MGAARPLPEGSSTVAAAATEAVARVTAQLLSLAAVLQQAERAGTQPLMAAGTQALLAAGPGTWPMLAASCAASLLELHTCLLSRPQPDSTQPDAQAACGLFNAALSACKLAHATVPLVQRLSAASPEAASTAAAPAREASLKAALKFVFSGTSGLLASVTTAALVSLVPLSMEPQGGITAADTHRCEGCFAWCMQRHARCTPTPRFMAGCLFDPAACLGCAGAWTACSGHTWRRRRRCRPAALCPPSPSTLR